MRKQEEYTVVGFAKKPHGIKGEIKIDLEETRWPDLEQAEFVFLEVAGKKVPYFIEWLRGAAVPLLKLELIDSPEAAQEVTPGEIFLPTSELVTPARGPAAADQLQYAFLEGYLAFDKEMGELGYIDAVVEYPEQEIAEVRHQGKTVLIPLHESLIVQLDEKQQLVYFDLPAGLLDI